MHTSEPSTMPLREHEEAIIQTKAPDRHSPDRPLEPEGRQDADRAIVEAIALGQVEPETPAWWHYFQQSSRLLIAVIEP